MNKFAIEAIGRAQEFPLRLSDCESVDEAATAPALDKALAVEDVPVLVVVPSPISTPSSNVILEAAAVMLSSSSTSTTPSLAKI